MAPLTKASDARRIADVSPAGDTSEELQTKMKLLIMSKDELVNAAAEFTAGDTTKQTAVITILEGEQADRSAIKTAIIEQLLEWKYRVPTKIIAADSVLHKQTQQDEMSRLTLSYPDTKTAGRRGQVSGGEQG